MKFCKIWVLKSPGILFAITRINPVLSVYRYCLWHYCLDLWMWVDWAFAVLLDPRNGCREAAAQFLNPENRLPHFKLLRTAFRYFDLSTISVKHTQNSTHEVSVRVQWWQNRLKGNCEISRISTKRCLFSTRCNFVPICWKSLLARMCFICPRQLSPILVIYVNKSTVSICAEKQQRDVLWQEHSPTSAWEFFIIFF